MGEGSSEPRSYRWAQHKLRLSGALIGAAVVGAGVWAGMNIDHTVTGFAVANPVGVIQAAAERQKAAELAAAEEKKRADEQFLVDLEREVQEDMRGYFADPSHPLYGDNITIGMVSLVKVSEGKFEGMVRMSALGNAEQDVMIHVTADDRKLMWSTDEGALMPLYR